MNLLNSVSRAVFFVVCFCFVGKVFAQNNDTDSLLEPSFFIKPSSESRWGNIDNFYVNENLHMFFTDTIDDHIDLFYSNIELVPEFINITEIINAQLLQLGYIPKSYSTQKNCKPWECNYFLDYELNAIYSPGIIDKNGNILITFTHEGNKKRINNSGEYKWLKQLGVWNKEQGFKVIDINGIDDIEMIIGKKDYLFVKGFNESTYQRIIAVISIADGYWGELKQIQPVEQETKPVLPEESIQIPEKIKLIESKPQPEVIETEAPMLDERPITEKPTSWWDRIKPRWWWS